MDWQIGSGQERAGVIYAGEFDVIADADFQLFFEFTGKVIVRVADPHC